VPVNPRKAREHGQQLTHEQQLELASRAFAVGNLAVSEIMCRNILDEVPQSAAALDLLGVIAARVGAVEHAAAYFEAALSADPNNEDARKHSEETHASRFDDSAVRYLVIKGWGSGFWSDVTQVLGSLLLAEITGRIPVTHWGKNSLFSDGSDRDAFAHYFEPVSKVSLADLACIDGADFFPAKWSRINLADGEVAKWSGTGSRAAAVYFLNRPETIAVSDFYTGVVDVAPWSRSGHPMHGKRLDEIYRYLVSKYLRPHTTTRSACEAFVRAHLDGAPFVAVHVRGSDKVLEDKDLHGGTNRQILSALDAVDPAWRIFLLTDDEHWRTRVESTYGDRVVTTNCQRTSTSTGVHYLNTIDRVQAGMEVMADTYIALRANRFIGNGQSNVSAMIAVMKDWPPGDCTLVGPSELMKRNLFVHLKP
jgi:protein O-GlcNAc transferase